MKKVITRKRCEVCSKGEVIFDTSYNVYSYSNSIGNYYPHRCTNCDSKLQILNKNYPEESLEFEPQEIEEAWE